MDSARTFPDWAPKRLVEEFNRLHAKVDRYRQLDLEFKNEPTDSDNQCMECGINSWKNAADKVEKLTIILHGLLTNKDMEAVWKTIQRPAVDPKPWKDQPDCLLWNNIVRALKDFSYQFHKAKTPANRSKNLELVVAMAKKLQNAIATDPDIKVIAKELMANHLAILNLEYRCGREETPSQAEFTMPLTLSEDCYEASLVHDYDDMGYDFDTDTHIPWEKRPLVYRLSYWATEAEKTSFQDLLDFFIRSLNAEAKNPQEIKQPGRGEAAFKPFLIRRVSEHMLWLYGQPLDDAVALIVSIALNLQNPLTRDDVRPYVTGTGKKFINKT